ncbi:hypothetical protein AB0368_38225, partial [Actinoplanes sp. NPDC051475]|uniref:hypothetical protein n=1 Tax=Actinoplanes sp. NPDC051475 TaxID=3157225 RepID=UPI00344C0D9B
MAVGGALWSAEVTACRALVARGVISAQSDRRTPACEGSALNPVWMVRRSELPPIRLHDLRHCAATYLKASCADLKD